MTDKRADFKQHLLRQAGDSVHDRRVRQLVDVAVDLAFAPSDYLRRRYERLVELLGHDPLQ